MIMKMNRVWTYIISIKYSKYGGCVDAALFPIYLVITWRRSRKVLLESHSLYRSTMTCQNCFMDRMSCFTANQQIWRRIISKVNDIRQSLCPYVLYYYCCCHRFLIETSRLFLYPRPSNSGFLDTITFWRHDGVWVSHYRRHRQGKQSHSAGFPYPHWRQHWRMRIHTEELKFDRFHWSRKPRYRGPLGWISWRLCPSQKWYSPLGLERCHNELHQKLMDSRRQNHQLQWRHHNLQIQSHHRRSCRFWRQKSTSERAVSPYVWCSHSKLSRHRQSWTRIWRRFLIEWHCHSQ